ncbi:MAG TPA: hypothetical protein VIZ31_07320, partial [Vicinamibacteria bacterium]
MALLAYAAFALVALAGPGRGVQRGLGLRPDAALVLPIGLVVCAAAQAVGLALGSSGWTWALVLGLNLLNFRPLPHGVEPRGDAASWRGALVPWLAGLALLAPTQFPWNRVDREGAFLLDPLAPYDDAVFHVGLARELTLGLHPQVPGLSGIPLGYHLGQGLVRAAALLHASVEPFDQISRFDPALLTLGLILALRALVTRLGYPPLAVTLTGFSLFFTDFSFVFAGQPSAFYWTDLLKGNLLLSLAYVNPVVPGLLVLLGLLVALARHEAGEGRSWLAVALLLSAALPHFKVFLGAHLLLGLAAAALFASGPEAPRARRTLALVGLPCLLMTLALALGQGGAAVNVVLAPFDLARITRESLDLPPLSGAAFVGWCALWLFASLGLRWLGLGPALRALREAPRAGSVAAAMALTAWPIGLAFRIAVKDALPGQKVANDAAYIVEQGAPLLWIFAAVGLAALAARRGRFVAVALTLLALPATVQFVARKSTAPPDRLPADMVRATAALR